MVRKAPRSAPAARAKRDSAGRGARAAGRATRKAGHAVAGSEAMRGALAALLRNRRAETVGRLAGGIAHELNNLLTVVIGALDVFAIELPPESSFRGPLEAAQEAAVRAAEVARRVLLYAAERRAGTAPGDPAAIVGAAVELLRRGLPRNIRLEVRVPDGLPPVRGDAGRLEAALVDLGINARDAMPDGGELSIVVEDVSYGGASAPPSPGARPGRYVRIAVRDGGCGMDAATAARAFEPFFTTRPPGDAAGLGLSAVRDAVDACGGRVDVRPVASGGCEFIVHLPAAEIAAAATVPRDFAVPREVVRGRGEAVLVVDDDADVLRATERMLAAIGYRVLTADSGPGALALIARGDQPIDLLLLDIVMPGMGGLATLRRVRERNPGLPALLMTGFAGRDFVPPVDLGAEIVPKPLDLGALSAAVRRAIDGGRPGGGAQGAGKI
ncbi:MAG: response regulator [Deltaproteobacteria bacterium]|nr:response regulator [Deltaproteobacteria bacterium]